MDVLEVLEDVLKRSLGEKVLEVGGKAWKAKGNGSGSLEGRDLEISEQRFWKSWGRSPGRLGAGRVQEVLE